MAFSSYLRGCYPPGCNWCRSASADHPTPFSASGAITQCHTAASTLPNSYPASHVGSIAPSSQPGHHGHQHVRDCLLGLLHTAQPRLLPWPPEPRVPHLTHAALISPALVPWLGSIMPALVSLSSKPGLMLSKPATATSSRASPTPMWPGTVRMPMRQSWAISPNNGKMSG